MIQFIIYTAKSPLNCNCTDWQGVMNTQYSLKRKSSENMVSSFTHHFSPFALNKVLLISILDSYSHGPIKRGVIPLF